MGAQDHGACDPQEGLFRNPWCSPYPGQQKACRTWPHLTKCECPLPWQQDGGACGAPCPQGRGMIAAVCTHGGRDHGSTSGGCR